LLRLSTATINETLRILSLREDLLANVRTSEHLTKSVLLEIAKYAPEKQKSLLAKARKGHLTVRSARQANRSDPDNRPRKGKAPSSDAGTTNIATQPQTVGEQLKMLFATATPQEQWDFLA